MDFLDFLQKVQKVPEGAKRPKRSKSGSLSNCQTASIAYVLAFNKPLLVSALSSSIKVKRVAYKVLLEDGGSFTSNRIRSGTYKSIPCCTDCSKGQRPKPVTIYEAIHESAE